MDRIVQLLIVSGTAGCAFGQLAAAPVVAPFAVDAAVEANWVAPPGAAYKVDVVADEAELFGGDEEVSVQSLPAAIRLARPATAMTVKQAATVVDTAGASVQSVANTVSTSAQGLSSLADAPYTGFDLLEWGTVWQGFRNRALGITGPDYVAYIQSFNGAELLNRFSTMELQPLIASILNAFSLPDVGQVLRSVRGMNISVLLPVVLRVLKDNVGSSGPSTALASARSLQDIIVGLNPAPIAQKLQAAGVPQFIEQHTGLDLSSYFAALATYNGQRLLGSLQSVSGSDLEQLARDLDAEDYLGAYLGLNTEALYSRLRAFSLASFLAADIVTDLRSSLGSVVAVLVELFRDMGAPLRSSTVRAPDGSAVSAQYGSVDILRVADAADKLLDKILGTTETEFVEVIRALNLPTAVQTVRSLDLQAVIAAFESSMSGMSVQQREQFVNKVLAWVEEAWTYVNGLTGAKIIARIEAGSGETLVNRLAGRNLRKYAALIADFGLAAPIERLTGMNVTPLVRAVLSMRLLDIVANLRQITGNDIVQFMDDAGINEYLTNAGYNVASLRSAAGRVSGAQLVDRYLNMSGRELLEELRGMDGRGLVNRVNQKANRVLTAGGVVVKLLAPSSAVSA